MRYIIVKHQNSSFGVLDKENNVLVIENESMGVCDSFIFAHLPGTGYDELTEVRDTYEKGVTVLSKQQLENGELDEK